MSKMQYTKIPYVGKPVSRILFGTAMPPFMTGGDGNVLLDAIYATGVNTFDTARNYMDAEISFDRWIEQKNMRDKIVPPARGMKRIRCRSLPIPVWGGDCFRENIDALNLPLTERELVYLDLEEMETDPGQAQGGKI